MIADSRTHVLLQMEEQLADSSYLLNLVLTSSINSDETVLELNLAAAFHTIVSMDTDF